MKRLIGHFVIGKNKNMSLLSNDGYVTVNLEETMHIDEICTPDEMLEYLQETGFISGQQVKNGYLYEMVSTLLSRRVPNVEIEDAILAIYRKHNISFNW